MEKFLTRDTVVLKNYPPIFQGKKPRDRARDTTFAAQVIRLKTGYDFAWPVYFINSRACRLATVSITRYVGPRPVSRNIDTVRLDRS